MGARSKQPAVWRPKVVSDPERELACARAIVQSPDLHEDATLKAACRLLRTVGIAADRQNAERALVHIESRAKIARDAVIGASSRAHAFERMDRLPAWAKGFGISAILFAIATTTLLLS